ncbi:type II secretion system GspH family protein, partial [Myxococcota bacterium]|nr:type II secretion system GspH family protein [Myxococcota bacterium]
MRRSRPQKTRAFTLIELMIVVVIMAILAAVVAPMIIARATRDGAADTPAQALEQSPLLVGAISAAGDGGAVLAPRMRSSDVSVKLVYAPVLVGRTVRSRYVATFRGTFEVENVDPRAERLALHFPFPPGMAEARRVSLRLRGADGALAEPDGVRYGLDGIRWDGAVAPGAILTAVVAYELVGQDAFTYAVASEGRTGKVRVTIDVEGPGAPEIPAHSLEPTTVEDGRFAWDVAELVANRAIVVELPPGSSPLGRLVLLLRYAALAVLMFGAGFWYLSEGDRPGRLDGFRFPHFLLLATNYSLFFAVLGVVLQVLPTPAALGAAACVSFPLLGLHVARITTPRFALTRVLPLATYTLATVVAAVFLEAHRPIVLLAATIVAIGWVTVTYRAWDAGRATHQREKAERARAEAARLEAVRVEAVRVEAARVEAARVEAA